VRHTQIMAIIRRILGYLFLFIIGVSILDCGRPGTLTGGPQDVTPPELIRAVPQNMTTNFDTKKIRLYFDEYIKLKDVQSQLIVSPPLKYIPTITPQSGASKFVEIQLKDTLRPNTTYTLNFGQSIIDNNEGNPNSFLTYVFSTGDYIDSLEVFGVVKDAFNKEADTFISVMLYEIDSTYTDSTVYQRPPNYITNTLDSTTVFRLQNLKEGKYALFGIKDEARNNVFDQNSDKIAFVNDTVTIPTDSIYLLTLFREIQDYAASVPSFTANNRILFGYNGEGEKNVISPLTILPDSVRTIVTKEPEKDTLNYWITSFEADSLIFAVTNETLKVSDTFTVKPRKLSIDSLNLTPSIRGTMNFEDRFFINSKTPVTAIDTTKIALQNRDTIPQPFQVKLDTLNNKIAVDFDLEPNEAYAMTLYPGAVTDFFESTNDTIQYRLNTGSYADYGNLGLVLVGNPKYPLIVQLIDQSDEVLREIYAEAPKKFEFNNLNPSNYGIRIIYDSNENGIWDTGNYLKRIQPEKVLHYPDLIEIRANWEKEETFILSE